MSMIGLKDANCKNCYKCVRFCPVKSIKVEDEQAKIMQEDCILCGRCLEVCPQNAKMVYSELEEVKELIKSGEKVVVSLAPSFLASFKLKYPGQMVTALKKIGFYDVLETAQGAIYVTDQYHNILKSNEQNVVVSTCCPTANDYFEKYHPEIIENLATVVSPMIAHGMLIKKMYGNDVKVVFIGPCISKKREAKDVRHDNIIENVLTFQEVMDWLKTSLIDPYTLPETPFGGNSSNIARRYPLTFGVIDTLKKKEILKNYDYIAVSGIDELHQLALSIKNNALNNCFVEVNACTEGCINGPQMCGERHQYFKGQIDIKNYSKKNEDEYPTYEYELDLNKTFIDKKKYDSIPSETAIREILKKIGKETIFDELNCGSCGYPSCREKAIAVYQNKAQLYMCMPYMNEMTQSLSTVILDNTPNIILAVNTDLKIVEVNHKAQEAFAITRHVALNSYLSQFMDTKDIEEVFITKKPIIDKKVSIGNIKTEANILFVPKHNVVIAIYKDITLEEKEQEKKFKLKMDTINMAQNVINKQMTVAQEIASLLGETTAETKVTLTKLKDMIVYDGEE